MLKACTQHDQVGGQFATIIDKIIIEWAMAQDYHDWGHHQTRGAIS